MGHRKAITAALPHGQDMSVVTKRKPKPKPRKASGPTLEQRVDALFDWADQLNKWSDDDVHIRNANNDVLRDCVARLDALESRERLRDKSHDEPVSNAGEAIGQHFRIVGEHAPWWRRLIGFMGSP